MTEDHDRMAPGCDRGARLGGRRRIREQRVEGPVLRLDDDVTVADRPGAILGVHRRDEPDQEERQDDAGTQIRRDTRPMVADPREASGGSRRGWFYAC